MTLNEYLLTLLQSALNEEQVKRNVQLTTEDWNNLFMLAKKQGVSAVAKDSRVLKSLHPKGEDMFQWDANALQTNLDFNYVCEDLSKLLHFHNSHNTKTLLLKGLSLSAFYPKPENRLYSDLDIYQFEDQAQADKNIANELHLEVKGTANSHHTNYTIGNTLVENHITFLDLRYGKLVKAWEKLLEDIVEKESFRSTFGKESVLIASPTFNALYLMMNMALKFLSNKLRLRYLCDWYCFLKAESSFIDWELVQTNYKDLGLNAFANAITGILVDNLGLNPNCLPYLQRNKSLEQQILNDIWNNFFDKDTFYKRKSFKQRKWKYKLILKQGWRKSYRKRFEL